MAISYLVIGPLFLSLNLLQPDLEQAIINCQFRQADGTICLHTVTGDCRDGWTKFQGSCYLFASDQASWPEAEAFCLSMNSNLVEIGSESENAFVEGELKIIHGHDSHSSHQNEVSYWLGGNDLEMEGTFKWVRSDAPLVFADWNPGQPDDFSSGEDCIELQGAMDYHWNDLSCSARHRFICESSAYGPDSGAISSVIGKR